jgi:uncharacterized membrane protein
MYGIIIIIIILIILIIIIIIIEIQRRWTVNKGDTSNNRGDWDYSKVIEKIREQHTGKT